jgi:hypothetical protein
MFFANYKQGMSKQADNVMTRLSKGENVTDDEIDSAANELYQLTRHPSAINGAMPNDPDEIKPEV